MGRSPCCSKEGMNRGAWTTIEDRILADYIKIHGEGGWRNLPKKAGLKRCGKSCRLRWMNYLRPDIKRGNISHDEEELILRLHRLLGNRWSLIAGRLPGRTDNEIKNYWNTNLGKKVHGHTASTLSRKNSNQSNNKKKPELIRPPSPKMESRVVRTKALRCTKPFVTPQPDIGPSMVRELVNNKAVEAESCDGVSSVTPLEDHSSDFMMDLNMGELFLSNFLDNDLSQLCDFNNSIVGVGSNDNRSNDDFSPSTDQPFLFSDEMLENWTGNDSVQQDFDMDLQSFLGVYS